MPAYHTVYICHAPYISHNASLQSVADFDAATVLQMSIEVPRQE
jgi:hypothetical protein